MSISINLSTATVTASPVNTPEGRSTVFTCAFTGAGNTPEERAFAVDLALSTRRRWVMTYTWQMRLPSVGTPLPWTTLVTRVKNVANVPTYDTARRRASLTDTYVSEPASIALNGAKIRCIVKMDLTRDSTAAASSYTTISNVFTWNIVESSNLFDTSSFSIAPVENKSGQSISNPSADLQSLYIPALIAAANRWTQYIRMAPGVIGAIRSQSGYQNWNGIKINKIIMDDYSGITTGGVTENTIAACGITAYQQLSFSGVLVSPNPPINTSIGGLLFHTVSINLYINTKYRNTFSSNQWQNVFVHELGHALGIGTYWQNNLTKAQTVISPIGDLSFSMPSTANRPAYTVQYKNIRGLEANVYANQAFPVYRQAMAATVPSSSLTTNSLPTKTVYPSRPIPLESTSANHWSPFAWPIVWSNNRKLIPVPWNDIMYASFNPNVNRYITSLSIKMLTEFGYQEINPGTSEAGLVTNFPFPASDFVIQSGPSYSCNHCQKLNTKK